VRIRRNVSDPVVLEYSEGLQCGRPSITAVKKLFIRKTKLTVNYSFPRSVQPAGTPGKFQWS